MPRIEASKGMGALALRFVIPTACRSGEVRLAAWEEIDMDAGIWTIPAERMKGGREHRVPLSAPALAVLESVKPLKENAKGLVFPSKRAARPLSDMTLAAVLKRLEVPVTVHGMRSTFRDWAKEKTGFSHEVKEAALAYVVANKVEAAYRRTDLLDKRRGLMDAWGEYAVGTMWNVARLAS